MDVEGKTRGKWQSTGLVIQTGDGTNLGEKWRQDISQGADHVLRESWVTASDPHYDAKLWPHLHPYSSGSLLSEPGTGGMARLVKNRLLLAQSAFRNNNLYAFWYLNRMICSELFFAERMRKKRVGADATTESADPITRLFGTAMPNSIPESSAWSRA